MAKLAPIFNDAQLINGIPANGAKLFTYVAGSSTKQATYTDEAGLTAQSNPIVLNSRGEPAQPIWLTEGLSYKFVFAPSTDSDPPVSPIRTIDNITGINDASLTIDQWVNSGLIPTYVSPTSFTLPGDQTSAFHVNRMLKSAVTAGTTYSRISSSVFTTLTTVTVVNLNGLLDGGLSSVSYGVETAVNSSQPIVPDTWFGVSGSSDTTKLLAFEVDGFTTATKRTATWPDKNGTVAFIDDITSPIPGLLYNVGLSVTMATNAVTIALKGADGNDPSSTNRVNVSYRNATLTNGQSTTVTTTSALSTVISSNSTGGTVSGVPSRIWVAAILVSGATELAWFNSVSGNTIAPINENGLISTTAEGGAGAADSAQVWYSTTARSNVPFVVLGYFDSTQATAGTWATPVTSININPINRPGDVLQKQFAIKTDTQTHSTTYTDVTGLSLSLTPRAAANKVAYNCVLNIGVTGGGGAVAKAIRDSTDLFVGDAAGSRIRASTSVVTLNSNVTAATSIYGIDSPNTTSAVTYKVAFQGFGGTAVYINRSPADTDSTSFMRTASTLYVEEISV